MMLEFAGAISAIHLPKLNAKHSISTIYESL